VVVAGNQPGNRGAISPVREVVTAAEEFGVSSLSNGHEPAGQKPCVPIDVVRPGLPVPALTASLVL
jgi:hypothetical protein